MSRDLSEAIRAALYAENSSDFPIALLTITHSDMPDPIRVSSDPTERLTDSPEVTYGTVSRGQTYAFIPFRLQLPVEDEDAPPTSRIVMENIGLELIELIRSISEPAQFLIELVFRSDLDTVEVSFPPLDLVSADYDAATVTLELTIDSLEREPCPAGSFIPSRFPGLFG